MLLDQYKICNDKDTYEHYEYRVSQWHFNGIFEISAAISGISLIEEYVSGIVGRRVCFSLFRESRFFVCSMEGNEDGGNMVLDISVSGIDEENYEIVADIIESERVLMEICGVVSVLAERGSV